MARRLVLALALALAACKAGPDYERPPAPVPAAFKEAEGWKPATPLDALDRGSWWAVYRDPLLDQLIAQVEVSNQSLKASEAAFRASRATVRSASAALYPNLTVDASVDRTHSAAGGGRIGSGFTVSGDRTLYNLGAASNWELDIWGGVRRSVEADTATAQATGGDLLALRLSLQAQLASDYVQLRFADRQQRLLQEAVTAYTEARQITVNRYNAGVAQRSDVMQAETQLETTRSQAVAVGVQRAQFEHAIAALTGRPPAELTVAPTPELVRLPDVPLTVPSALLERRPDIAAAERRMAGANAQIGVAEAAFFPTLALTGSYGYTSTLLGDLVRAQSAAWSIGPQMLATLFDAGLRSAAVEQNRAAYDQAGANYRQTVLAAFQDVEDQLSSLRILAQQAEVVRGAVAAAREAERLTLNQYRAGTAAYTTVITAQTAALNNELTELAVEQSRVLASVGLIRALGGGWDATALPQPGKLYDFAPLDPAAKREPPGFWTGLGTAIRNLVK